MAIDRVFFGGAQQALRPGTPPLPLAVGFGVASKLATAGLETHVPRMAQLAQLLLKKLQEGIAGLQLNGGEPRLPGLLNIRLPGVNAQDIMLELAGDICVSTGAACASGQRKPSPILRRPWVYRRESIRACGLPVWPHLRRRRCCHGRPPARPPSETDRARRGMLQNKPFLPHYKLMGHITAILG